MKRKGKFTISYFKTKERHQKKLRKVKKKKKLRKGQKSLPRGKSTTLAQFKTKSIKL